MARQLQFYVDDAVVALLDRTARERGLSRTRYVEHIINAAVGYVPPVDLQALRPNEPSVSERKA